MQDFLFILFLVLLAGVFAFLRMPKMATLAGLLALVGITLAIGGYFKLF